ncbi:uncharacterized protein SPPG_07634 [Spizellomyces punctatus DAOM BR117]|uniref:G-protein coupled receptors family 1 profile domain-containing protein n=1 Tax=Spizellomyces punctatus (strain DAOM BR117) TaxID=645134 RepID=A0A0L0H7Q1_SPIPD|nr:uncharacterized protein SPPG_07634 [Spizellomyces punctatus DAOM BR117]KNC97247.1 hypothetical protein SPPG_07634 [Spizellomyces punctatus DAOM BR117]|eukprot:XP_016605287.1 hypothetical protein SPPG_07634 [Spizellomyces punctatus DAOM BR117]
MVWTFPEVDIDPADFPVPFTIESQVMVAVVCIPLIISFSINGLLLYVFAREKPLWTSSNMLLMSMSLADFLHSFTSVPVLLWNLAENAYVSPVACKWQGALALFTGSAQLITMSTIAIERYFAIVKQSPMPTRNVLAMASVPWFTAFGIAGFPFLLGTLCRRPTNVTCAAAWWTRETRGVIFTITCFAILSTSMSLTVLLYYKTWLVVRNQTRELQDLMKSRITATTVATASTANAGQSIIQTRAMSTQELPPERSRLRRLVDTCLEVVLFVMKGANADQDEHEVSGQGTGSRGKAPRQHTTQRRQVLEKIVFNRSLRIVAVFFLGWALYNVMFVLELIMGRPVPLVMDYLAHALVCISGICNMLIMVTDNNRFNEAFRRHLGVGKFRLERNMASGSRDTFESPSLEKVNGKVQSPAILVAGPGSIDWKIDEVDGA